MVDEDDRCAAGFQIAHIAEKFLHFLGNQNRCGLIEDEYLGAAIEHLDDFHALAFADLERLDKIVGVDSQSVRLGDLGEMGTCSGEVDQAVLHGLGTQDHIFHHGQLVGEHEVLVDHADAQLDGI